MTRRALTLLVAGLLAVLLSTAGAFLPVPYVVLGPGPTYDTLGSQGGKPVIQVSGHQTYPTSGHLNLVTVAYRGGPGDRLDLFTALRAWLDPRLAVVPEETIFPPGESVQQVEQENVQEMTDSQQVAVAVALRELGYAVPRAVTVAEVKQGMPAQGVLAPGDIVTAVDGSPVGDPDQLRQAIGRRAPGQPVELTINRAGRTQQVRVATVADASGHAVVGFAARQGFSFPFPVKINVGDVGGPSAGLMFALGLIDKLTPGDLTGGKFIAGTGTLDPGGKVGPIGGIQQKMAAARAKGATIFLTPGGNCAAARADRPAGLRLVRVDTLTQALQALQALRTGHGAVPACPG